MPERMQKYPAPACCYCQGTKPASGTPSPARRSLLQEQSINCVVKRKAVPGRKERVRMLCCAAWLRRIQANNAPWGRLVVESASRGATIIVAWRRKSL